MLTDYTPIHLYDPAPPRSVKIPLYDAQRRLVDYAIVDALDAERLMQWRWRIERRGSKASPLNYAARKPTTNGKRELIWMHREILGLPRGLGPFAGPVVDHVNGDSLDNRRSNLMPTTNAQNVLNRRRAASASKYPGVAWIAARSLWRARGTMTGKRKFLGYFDSEQAAARAVKAWSQTTSSS